MNKIAVFFDSDNLNARCAPFVVNELEKNGEILIQQAFGDFANRRDWAEYAQKNSIQTFHVPSIKGKNSSDIALIIQAMKVLAKNTVNVFAIVSSDSDFTALALEIKSAGLKVIGFGEEKTTPRTRESYSDFVVLPKLQKEETPQAKPAPTLKTADVEPEKNELKLPNPQWRQIKKALLELFNANKDKLDEQGFYKFQALGSDLKIQKQLSAKDFGFISWRELFKNNPSLGKIENDAFRVKTQTATATTAIQSNNKPAPQKTAPAAKNTTTQKSALSQQNEQSQPPLHKLKPAQVLELRKILEEVFNNKTSEMDSAGFLDMNKICPALNQKAPLKNYTAKTYQSLFKSNPILGEYKKGKFKFKKI